MTITQTQKRHPGQNLQPLEEFLHIGEGASPKLPKAQVAAYLPVLRQDDKSLEWFVVLSGMLVSRDIAARGGRLVLANGGTGTTLAYTASDIDYTLDLDAGDVDSTAGTFVAAAGASTATVAANYPIGFAPYHYLSGRMRLAHKNYEKQPDVAVLNRGTIELPVNRVDQASLDEGRLLMPALDGYAILWDGVDASQIVGRVLWRDAITAYPGTAGLAKVRTLQGVALAGANTAGAPGHLYGKAHEAGGSATDYVRVNITLL